MVFCSITTELSEPSMFLILAAAAIVVPSGVPFTCTPVRVWDGDGPVWCKEGPRGRRGTGVGRCLPEQSAMP